MKYIFITISFFLFSNFSIAQNSFIKGQVLDGASGDPMEFTNIAILSPGDSSVVTGIITDFDGKFNINVKPGNYLIRISYVGYKDRWRKIVVSESGLDLKKIKVSPDTEILTEVNIDAVAPLFESDIDKRVFNVANSIVAEGGTAIDLLETLPSVQIDEEGNISMRGSGDILIYINGRPTNMMADGVESVLEQFPANSIEKIELITNPSSRYDAQGTGGIINLVLKKNQADGFNGQINGSIGTRNKYTGGINMNYRKGAWNFYGAYNYQFRQLFRESESFRENLVGNGSRFLDQDNYMENYDESNMVRFGFDVDMTENSALGVFFSSNIRNGTRDGVYNIRHQNVNRAQDSLYVRNRDETQNRTNIEAGLNYSLNIDTTGQKLFSQFSFSRDEQETLEVFDQDFFDAGNNLVPQNQVNQLFDQPRFNEQYLIQVDYEKPFGEDRKLEAGYKSTISINDREQVFSDLDQEIQEYVINDTISNRFLFDEGVHAAYLMYRNSVNRIGFQAGLRGEATFTESYQVNLDSTFVNNYFNLFPSIYLSYKLTEKQDILLNYSRRIRRPSVWSLNPFINAQDPLNLRVGNPFLRPELTDSYEVSYQYEGGNLFFTGSGYFRQTNDVITRVFSLLDNNVGLMGWENINTRQTSGLELITQYSFASWADATLTTNLFYTKLFGDNLGEGFNNENLSWSMNLLSNFAIPKLFSVQLQANYRGPIVLPQGELEPYYGVNIGIRKDIMDKRATISANLTDVFNSRVFKIRTEDNRFIQDRLFNRETQIFTLSFTYRLGGFKDRNGKRDGDHDGDDMDNDMF